MCGPMARSATPFIMYPSPEQYALPSSPSVFRSLTRPVPGSPMYAGWVNSASVEMDMTRLCTSSALTYESWSNFMNQRNCLA